MLSYGWAKVLPSQFGMTLEYMALEVGQHNPRDQWAFMIRARDYQIFTGFVEVAGGLLLLTRRTAMLGAIISMAAMANVLALDISYDEPIVFLAGQIFLMSLFVSSIIPKRRNLNECRYRWSVSSNPSSDPSSRSDRTGRLR